MRTEIVKSLAAYLEAIPYQIEAWDRRVIEHLAANPGKLSAFRAGTDEAKWQIYSSIKYQA